MQLRLSATNLPNLDPAAPGTSDAYAKLFTQLGGTWEQAGVTEVVPDNTNPQWQPFTIKAASENSWFKIEVWDHDEGKDDFIGNVIVSVADFLSSEGFKTVPLSQQGTLTIEKV
ncbi:C2 domain-containing protein [Streptomyces sp. NPDC058471]|uniref:C2 domain-containing protein n=1 Tax=Streptomyces sp. NPDC058471 TaxID=3346516 RepID=UPI0036616F43